MHCGHEGHARSHLRPKPGDGITLTVRITTSIHDWAAHGFAASVMGETMGEVEGARTFQISGASYDSFMGRYSIPLRKRFADFAGVVAGETALDVGCGPGALTSELVSRLGASSVAACDPSPSFVAACAERNPGVGVVLGSAEALPYEDARFDHVLAQLVLHFVSDPDRAAAEMSRVLRPGGRVSLCVWDSEEGMQMLATFYEAARSIDPSAPHRSGDMRFGRESEIVTLLDHAGFTDLREERLAVEVTYPGFDDLWAGFLGGVGPAGSYLMSLDDAKRRNLRSAFFEMIGSPGGSFSLSAVAIAAAGRKMG